MSRNNLPDHWDAQEHPSLDMLRQYQTGELPAPLHNQLEQHLVSCELCSDLLEGMTLSQPARVKLAVRETRGRLKNLLAQKKRKRKTFQWPIWQTAAVLLVLLFAVAEVVYHHYFAKPEKTTTEQTQPAPATWRLHGQVITSAEAPLDHATVYVNGSSLTVKTDANGYFEADISTGKADLLVTAPGYISKGTLITQTIDTVKISMAKTN